MINLITGASGFLGGRLAQVLSEQGKQVRVLARPNSHLDHLEGYPVEVMYGSLADSESLRRAAAGCQVIYHCAGTSTDWAPWDTYYQTNVVGVRNLTEAALCVPTLERFVHISTSDVYGYPALACDETYPLTDVGLPYNRSKLMGERVVWETRAKGLPVTVIRPVSVYGPRSKDFVYEIAALIWHNQMMVANGGRSRAGLLYIDNAVEGILRAASAPEGQAYNLRDTSDETWRQYVDALADIFGKPYPWLNMPSGMAFILARLFERTYRTLPLKGKPMLTRHAVLIMCRDQGYSIAKAQRDFGFESKIGFAEGVQRAAEWFQSTM